MKGRIVVGTDGSEGSYRALLWALQEAAMRGSPVHAVIAWHAPATYSRDVYFPAAQEGIAQGARAQLDQVVERARVEFPHAEIVPLVLEGEPSRTLCGHTAEGDLLVVGSRGHTSVTGLLLGSVSSRCAHHSRSPVVIVPAGWEAHDAGTRGGQIVVGVDGSPGSAGALRWAVSEAAIRQKGVRAVTVWQGTAPSDDMTLEWATLPSLAHHDRMAAGNALATLAGIVSELAAAPAGPVEQVVIEGEPAATLCLQAADADMLVVGSRGHGALAGLLLGSVSSRCARHSPVPLAVVPVGSAVAPPP